MKGSINKTMLLGRIGQDPDIKKTDTYTLARFSIATNDLNSKTKEIETDWHKCVAFGKTADIVSQYIHKGDRVFIEGSIKQANYTKQDGTQVTGYNILVQSLTMLGENKKTQQTDNVSRGTFDDEVPF